MKYLSLFIVLLFVYAAPAKANAVYSKLCEVNKCWTERQNAEQALLPTYKTLDETGWIQLHLSLVEQTLRNRPTDGLTAQQKQNRQAALAHLHQYMLAGRYPQNEDYTYRTPIFIDKHDNFCAVGYLVKATGHEQVSRMIAAKTNLAYVREMNYPELTQWAQEYGFTSDELAWIQPGYPAMNVTKKVGRGTNGTVHELCVDATAGRLYVGGSFTVADSILTANNIAYVTEANGVYTWNTMGSGFNGPVYAIEKYGSNIFAAGSFTATGSTTVNNVAYWNGTVWQPAGCISGTVKDLIVFNGDLYASGSFDVCASMADINFAKWTGTVWQPIAGISGTVNTMEVVNNDLLLGGLFTYGTSCKNVIKWNTTSGFQPYAGNIDNEIRDFETVFDTLYAVCRQTPPYDTTLIYNLVNSYWRKNEKLDYFTSPGTLSLNTICVLEDTALVGGSFNYSASIGTNIYNCFNFSPLNAPSYNQGNFIQVNDVIHKFAVFNNTIIAGGAFNNGGLNGICRRQSIYPAPARLYTNARAVKLPCGASASGSLVTSSVGGYPPYKYNWSTGDTTATAINVPAGTHTVVVTDKKGNKDTSTISVSAIPFDLTVQLAGETITSAESTADTIRWVDCNNSYSSLSATGLSYTAKKTASYAAVIYKTANKQQCIDTTICIWVQPSSVEDKHTASAIRLYPNPATDHIEVALREAAHTVDIEIMDITGRVVVSQTERNTGSTKLDLQAIPAGVYTLQLSLDKQQPEYYKLIKQ